MDAGKRPAFKLQNDIDTNEWWLRYDLDRDAATRLKAQLARVPAATVRVSKPARGRWWLEG